MKKEFVPYKEAVALKGIGFNEYTFEWYCEDTQDFCDVMKDVRAPLYQQAFRWFREKYNLHHTIIWDSDSNNYDAGLFGELVTPFLEEDTVFNTYEDAELACLRKLIEIVKNK